MPCALADAVIMKILANIFFNFIFDKSLKRLINYESSYFFIVFQMWPLSTAVLVIS